MWKWVLEIHCYCKRRNRNRMASRPMLKITVSLTHSLIKLLNRHLHGKKTPTPPSLAGEVDKWSDSSSKGDDNQCGRPFLWLMIPASGFLQPLLIDSWILSLREIQSHTKVEKKTLIWLFIYPAEESILSIVSSECVLTNFAVCNGLFW